MSAGSPSVRWHAPRTNSAFSEPNPIIILSKPVPKLQQVHSVRLTKCNRGFSLHHRLAVKGSVAGRVWDFLLSAVYATESCGSVRQMGRGHRHITIISLLSAVSAVSARHKPQISRLLGDMLPAEGNAAPCLSCRTIHRCVQVQLLQSGLDVPVERSGESKKRGLGLSTNEQRQTATGSGPLRHFKIKADIREMCRGVGMFYLIGGDRYSRTG